MAIAACPAFGTSAPAANRHFNCSVPQENNCIRHNGNKRFRSIYHLYRKHARQRFQVASLLHRRKCVNSDGNLSFTSPSCATFYRLFIGVHRFQGGIPNAAKEFNLGLSLFRLPFELQTAVEALKLKEEQIQVAQNRTNKQDGIKGKFAVLEGQKELQAAQTSYFRIKEELFKTKQKRYRHASELKKLKQALKQREKDARKSQEAFTKKQEECELLRREVDEKDEALSNAAAELESRNLRLFQADKFIHKQSMKLYELRKKIKRRERDMLRVEKEMLSKQNRIYAAEEDLEKHAIAWLAAQGELKALEKEMLEEKSLSDLSCKELSISRKLLAQIGIELQSSQRVIQDFRRMTEAQNMHLSQQQNDISQQKAALQSFEANFQQDQQDVLKEKEEFKSLQMSYTDLLGKLQEGKQKEDMLRRELQKERLALQFTMSELSSLKRDLQEKYSILYDTQLSLHLKEAELMAEKLEMQRLESGLASIQLIFNNRESELEAAKMTEDLREEIMHLKYLFKVKEEQFLRAASLLEEKYEQMNIMWRHLKNNKLNMCRATSIIEQITDFSKRFVDAFSQGSTAAVYKEVILIPTNRKFFADWSLLQKGLQFQHFQVKFAEDTRKCQEVQAELLVAKECLREEENKILKIHRDLEAEDQEVQKLFNRSGDAQFEELLHGVVDKANRLSTFHALAQSQKMAVNQSPGEAELEKLEFEASKLETEVAICAVRNLAELSKMLIINVKLDDKDVDKQTPIVYF